jgi:heptosyltransferase-2
MLKNIFFIRSDRLGEFLLSLFSIKLVKENYPYTKIYLLARKENIELVKGISFIDYFFEYKEDYFKGIKGAFHLAKLLRRENVDCIIILNPKKEFHFASFIAGVPLRVGYDRKWGFCLNKKIEDKKFLQKKHEVKYNIELVSLVCKEVFIPQIDLPVEKKDSLGFLKSDLDIEKDYFVIHPFSSHSSKKVEDQFWMKLTKELKEKFNKEIVLIGAREDIKEANVFATKMSVRSIVGKLNLKELATFLKYSCKVFIGLDSGPMHLASLLEIPTIGIFKITNPSRWAPFGERCLAIKWEDKDIIGRIVGFIERYIR